METEKKKLGKSQKFFRDLQKGFNNYYKKLNEFMKEQEKNKNGK